MKTPARLGLYGGGLALAFAGAFAAANLTVPESAVEAWNESTEDEEMDHGGTDTAHAADSIRGLVAEQDGYQLVELTAPDEVGTDGELEFEINAPGGEPLTEYAVSHDKELHLIVVRTDGAEFRHVHPVRDEDGTWSLPWTWEAAGTYRVYADFAPAADEDLDVTLTSTVDVSGDFAVQAAEPSPTAEVDGFEVALDGDLSAGSTSTLTFAVTRDGEPVTEIEPYLGAFGHLVALREGDLAYLHVHPEGDEPSAGQESGPEIVFAAEAPTEGRYLLYLDFQVDGQVRTAAFVVDTAAAAPETAPENQDEDTEESADETDGGHESDGHGHGH
ncbi:heavy-metal-associated domain-containing protein [Glycomyces buryatensis]|uniref:Heavy-metal-associated domain-containing protein n=1 Tax=Glycomyces buryatensis TaxID=2570927 RepID=A0A4S8QA54_9ACTN|nr:heavy-metal-associated domain-containing protein [Glycomyces buryatensis]THV41327.1 heavy-metal-associated domain-containing protein [Glycomyces buryatensis]